MKRTIRREDKITRITQLSGQITSHVPFELRLSGFNVLRSIRFYFIYFMRTDIVKINTSSACTHFHRNSNIMGNNPFLNFTMIKTIIWFISTHCPYEPIIVQKTYRRVDTIGVNIMSEDFSSKSQMRICINKPTQIGVEIAASQIV